MLANSCADIPVALRIVGASTPSMARWKNESQEHAAIARHGTHICQVTAESAIVAAVVFTLVVVDIDSSSTKSFPLSPKRRSARRLRLQQRHGSSDPGESETRGRRSRLSRKLP